MLMPWEWLADLSASVPHLTRDIGPVALSDRGKPKFSAIGNQRVVSFDAIPPPAGDVNLVRARYALVHLVANAPGSLN